MRFKQPERYETPCVEWKRFFAVMPRYLQDTKEYAFLEAVWLKETSEGPSGFWFDKSRSFWAVKGGS